MNAKRFVTLVIACAIVLGISDCWAGSGRAVVRAVSKAVSKSTAEKTAKAPLSKDFKAIFARDRKMHSVTPAKPAPRDRIVERYTTMKQAQHERKYGLAKDSHMTSRVHHGRPYSAETARNRLGIAGRVDAKETIRIPKGQPLRNNKALGGAPGVGETSSPKPLPKEAVLDVKAIRSSNGSGSERVQQEMRNR